MHSFEGMTIWILCRFGLKCLFTPPKFWFLEVKTPKRDWSSSRPLKGTSLAGTALTWRFWWRLVKRCDLGAWWRNQKKKRQGKKLTVANYWRSDMWSCMLGGLREVVISFKFRQNRMNRFWDMVGRNLPFPILKASGLYYCTSRDVMLW